MAYPPDSLRLAFSILISTGEPSGDSHAAQVARSLREQAPAIRVDALGGPALASVGATLRWETSRHAVLGFFEIISSIPRHARLLRSLDKDFRAGRYQLLLAVDYPGFNLRLAESARRAGTPVLYYIPPKHWATGTRLTARFSRAVSRVACILPFEPGYFAPFGIEAEYVGHPLLDRPALPTRSEARRRLGIPEEHRVLALFPGSRRQEVAKHWPIFRSAGEALFREGRCRRILVAAMPGMHYPDPGIVEPYLDRNAEILAASDAAIVKSGTATLEAALAGIPMVVAYRVHPMTAWLARRMLKVSWVSLVNLIAEREVVPELLQERMTVDHLAEAAAPLLQPEHPSVQAQREGFREVRRRLGGPGASRRVAEMALDILRTGA